MEYNQEVIFCPKCGAKNVAGSYVCENCGNYLPIMDGEEVRCPQCGSNQIEFVTYQSSNDFDKKSACCGYLLCGPIGLLCGFNDKKEAETIRKCKNCCKEF